MKGIYIIALASLIGPSAAAKSFVTVAVIDTGISKPILKEGYPKGMCKMGHKDFTGTGIQDDHGHGTNVSGLIHKYAGDAVYCQVILKFYDRGATGLQNIRRMWKAIEYAININVDIINISGGGTESNMQEMMLIRKALDRGIKVVVAAGNEHCDLDGMLCSYYPAMYDPRIIVVGNGTVMKRQPSSNWGSYVDVWEDGYNVKGSYGFPMTGTSQSTAIHTGKVVRQSVQSW